MKIRIEQKHIDSGKPSRAHSCALALAIKEQTGLQISCFELVHLTNADGSQGQTVCKLTDLAFDWIKRFDSDKSSVQPTVIDVPGLEDHCIHLGSEVCAAQPARIMADEVKSESGNPDSTHSVLNEETVYAP